MTVPATIILYFCKEVLEHDRGAPFFNYRGRVVQFRNGRHDEAKDWAFLYATVEYSQSDCALLLFYILNKCVYVGCTVSFL